MNPLTLPWKLIAEIVAALALFGAITFGIHQFLEHERDIGYQRAVAEYTAKDNEKLKAALAETAMWKQQYQEATQHAAEREKAYQALLASSGRAADSLQHTIQTIASGVPSATAEALRKTTATLTTVFGECAEEYRKMGKVAQGHADDSLTYDQAWPK